jgi:glycosyltransferase involved in cell wall biosynthesis
MHVGHDAAGSAVKISVIVPAFNSRHTVAGCIAALEAQEYPKKDYELIFVDNNSTDDSALLMARHAAVQVLHEHRQGSYAARNTGVRQARGAILAFTDSDCMPVPGWLQAIDDAFSDPGLHIVQGFRRPSVMAGSLLLLSRYEHFKDQYIFASALPNAYYGYTNNMAVRRDTFAQHGPFIEVLRGADTLFVRKVIEAAGCHVMAYSGTMAVVHAEMVDIAAYFRKMFIYGRAHQVATQSISRRKRFRAFQAAVRSSRFPWLAATQLFFILSSGMISWHLGRLGRLRLRSP